MIQLKQENLSMNHRKHSIEDILRTRLNPPVSKTWQDYVEEQRARDALPENSPLVRWAKQALEGEAVESFSASVWPGIEEWSTGV
ncbi:hypothetical protein [Roseateles sp. L2-2]|uniref:hypothetical protein n=1 Tax=Roseateles TaxID=93681 RepID=UPI003D36BF25